MSKRGAGAIAESPAKSSMDSEPDFQTLLQEFQTSINDEVKQTISSFEATVSSKFVNLVKQAEEINTKKFNHVNSEIGALKERQEKTDTDMANMAAQVRQLQATLDIAEKVTISQNDVDADDWS